MPELNLPAQLEKSFKEMIPTISNIEVKTHEDYESAVNLLTEVAKLKKEVEKRKEFFTAPLRKHINDINAFFNGFFGPIGKADKHLRGVTVAYLREHEESKSTLTASGGRVTSSEAWGFNVININDVPREFLMVDEGKIRAAISGGVRRIPGVEINKELRVSVYNERDVQKTI